MRKESKKFSFLPVAILFCVCLSLLILNINTLGIAQAASKDGGGLYVESGATYTMDGGKIEGKTAYGHGGGVYVGSGATFYMKGGTISNNVVDYNNFGGSSGGGVYVTSGATFYMDSGTISDNMANSSGGGVEIFGGKFVMNNGAITSNKIKDNIHTCGGGVSVYNGVFIMNGGIVSNNTSKTGSAFYLDTASLIYSAGQINGEIYCRGGGYIVYKAQPTSKHEISVLENEIGTKIAKLDGISTIDLSKLDVVNMPEGCELQIQTIDGEKWVVIDKIQSGTVTLTFSVNDSSCGYVSRNSIEVDKGTGITASGNTLHVGNYDIVAYAYDGYFFENWSIPSRTANTSMNIVANFSGNVDMDLRTRVEQRGALNIGLVGTQMNYLNGRYMPSWSELAYVMQVMFELGDGSPSLDNLEAIYQMSNEELIEYLKNDHSSFFGYEVNFIDFPCISDETTKLLDGDYGDLMETRTYDAFMKENDLDILLSNIFWTSSYLDGSFSDFIVEESFPSADLITFDSFFDYSLQSYIFNDAEIGYQESIYGNYSLISYLNDYYNLGPQETVIGFTLNDCYDASLDEFLSGTRYFYYGDYHADYGKSLNIRMMLPLLLWIDYWEEPSAGSEYDFSHYSDIIMDYEEFAYRLDGLGYDSDIGNDGNVVAFARASVWYYLYNNEFHQFSFNEARKKWGFGGDQLCIVDYLRLFMSEGNNWKDNLFSAINVETSEPHLLEPLVQCLNDMITLGIAHKAVFMRTSDTLLNGGSFAGDFLSSFRMSGLGNDGLRGFLANKNFQEREGDVKFMPFSDFIYDWYTGYEYVKAWNESAGISIYNQLILDTKKYFLEPIKDRDEK